MSRNEVLSRLWRPEKMDGADELTSASSFSSSPTAATAATTNSESEEVHVLAVDDSLVDRKVIEKLLKITSCKVTTVDSGRRALQFLGLDEEKNSVGFDGKKVDMIITDYCMPGMTGFELLKKIKGSSAFRQVPVVIMSSENILARIDSCFEEGAEDYIVKPVKLADVKRLKDSMFGGDRKLVKQETEINLQLTSDNVSSSNDALPTTVATTPSPPSSTSSSPPSSPKSFSSSSSSSSAPLADLSPPTSPTTILNSPTRRLKISNFDLP